jgi:hypothetical protein
MTVPLARFGLEMTDANPDPVAAVRTAFRRSRLRATDRVLWNHGGATSALRYPDFPGVINVLDRNAMRRAARSRAARRLECTTLYGGFRLGAASGL